MKEILFGMPTLIECSSLEASIKLCKELKLNFIEINMNFLEYQKNYIDISKINELIKNEDIFFTIHLDDNINICDFNEDVSAAYINTVIYAIEVAKELNIPIINMHMQKGGCVTLPHKKVYIFEQYKEKYLANLIRFRDMCEDIIGRNNIKICIENCDGYEDFMKEGIQLLLESDVFGLTLDIGHNYCAQNKDMKFIYKNVNKLNHMHIHDAVNDKDHLSLGSGDINLSKVISMAKEHSCTCVIETKTVGALVESVSYIKEYLR